MLINNSSFKSNIILNFIITLDFPGNTDNNDLKFMEQSSLILNNGNIDIIESRFENLKTSSDGGVVQTIHGNVSVTGSVFKGNSANKGGAMNL